MEDKDLVNLFIDEFQDLVNRCKLIVKNFNNNRKIDSNIKDLRKIFHTNKGNSGIMNLQNLYEFCYCLESQLNSNTPYNDELIFILIDSVDTIDCYLSNLRKENVSAINESFVSGLKRRIDQL